MDQMMDRMSEQMKEQIEESLESRYYWANELVTKFQEKRNLIQTAVLGLFVFLFVSLALASPDLDWDMLAYVGNASQLVDEKPIAELHNTLYEDLKNTVSASAYSELIGTPSRAVLSEDPEAFRQTMAFYYDTRIVYIGALAGFMKLGVEPFFASYLISILCAVASILLLVRLFPTRLPMSFCIVLPCIVMSCGLFSVARMSSPDALATLVTIGLYWMLIRDWKLSLLLLMPLCIFVRTDLILLLALFYGYFLLNNRYPKIAVVCSGVATLVLYWVLNHMIVDGEPWASVVGYKYIEKQTHPEGYSYIFGFTDYLNYLFIGAKTASYTPMVFIFIALCFTGICIYASRLFHNLGNRQETHGNTDVLFLLVSSLVYVVLHFLLFPVIWVRFFAAQYTLVAVVVLWTTLYLVTARNYLENPSTDLLNSN